MEGGEKPEEEQEYIKPKDNGITLNYERDFSVSLETEFFRSFITVFDDQRFLKIRGYLDLFDRYLRNNGYSDRFCMQHWNDLDEYLNYYTLHPEAGEIEDWCGDINAYFDYFIHTDQMVSVNQVNVACAGINCFYRCMRAEGIVTPEQCRQVRIAIAENRAQWVEETEAEQQRRPEKVKKVRPRYFIARPKPRKYWGEDDDDDEW